MKYCVIVCKTAEDLKNNACTIARWFSTSAEAKAYCDVMTENKLIAWGEVYSPLRGRNDK